jgi:hypothetical protein
LLAHVHALAPAGDVRPVPHAPHAAAPNPAAKVPAAHARQVWPVPKVPGPQRQSESRVEPGEDVVVPLGQRVQLTKPAV